MSDSTEDLAAIRDAIEHIDRQIIGHLHERMQLVETLVTAKLGRAVPLRDPEREEHVLQRIRHDAIEVGLDPHEVERIYRLVFEMAISRQQAHVHSLPDVPLRVGYQGVEGSYSHLAAQRRYAGRDGGVVISGYESVRKAVDAVREGDDDLALLPIENTTAGSINETYDLLAEGGVTIVGEEVRAIQHCLLGLPGTKVEDLRTVLSHPQGLLQCESFLRSASWIRPQAEFDTAGAARKVREGGDLTVGAIASDSAARVFGLEVLRRDIQSQQSNFTRFVEVTREAVPCPPEVACKTSLLLTVAHSPGALGRVLQVFERRSVNLAKLESRPVPGEPWQYRFYLDIEGHAASEPVARSLDEIRPHTGELRVLGTYPRFVAD